MHLKVFYWIFLNVIFPHRRNMQGKYGVFIRDKDGEIIQRINDFTSLRILATLNDIGSWNALQIVTVVVSTREVSESVFMTYILASAPNLWPMPKVAPTVSVLYWSRANWPWAPKRHQATLSNCPKNKRSLHRWKNL